MNKLRIALLSGGISSERDVSIMSGNQVFESLDKTRYVVTRYDPKTDLGLILSERDRIDLALVILHGPYGEDGTIQGFLDLLDIPYQGSGVLGSALAMNKVASKQLYEKNGIPTPSYVVLHSKESLNVDKCLASLGLPIVVKPVGAGSSIGMSLAKSKQDLEKAAVKAFQYGDTLLLETFLKGTELTGGVIGNEALTALPIVEIIPNANYDFFEYEAKYSQGETTEICPARISDAVTRKAQELSMAAHRVLHCTGYSRTDMIYHQDEIYVLETNTIPGMTRTSLLPQAAKAAGMSFSDLLDRLIELGIEAHQKKQSK